MGHVRDLHPLPALVLQLKGLASKEIAAGLVEE